MIKLINDQTGEAVHIKPIWTVLIENRHVRYIHTGVEADDAGKAARIALDAHAENEALHGCEVYVFPNETMSSYLVRQDTSFKLVEQ